MCFDCVKKKNEKFDIYYCDKCKLYFNTEKKYYKHITKRHN